MGLIAPRRGDGAHARRTSRGVGHADQARRHIGTTRNGTTVYATNGIRDVTELT
jgi:hypothetical protein